MAGAPSPSYPTSNHGAISGRNHVTIVMSHYAHAKQLITNKVNWALSLQLSSSSLFNVQDRRNYQFHVNSFQENPNFSFLIKENVSQKKLLPEIIKQIQSVDRNIAGTRFKFDSPFACRRLGPLWATSENIRVTIRGVARWNFQQWVKSNNCSDVSHTAIVVGTCTMMAITLQTPDSLCECSKQDFFAQTL